MQQQEVGPVFFEEIGLFLESQVCPIPFWPEHQKLDLFVSREVSSRDLDIFVSWEVEWRNRLTFHVLVSQDCSKKITKNNKGKFPTAKGFMETGPRKFGKKVRPSWEKKRIMLNNSEKRFHHHHGDKDDHKSRNQKHNRVGSEYKTSPIATILNLRFCSTLRKNFKLAHAKALYIRYAKRAAIPVNHEREWRQPTVLFVLWSLLQSGVMSPSSMMPTISVNLMVPANCHPSSGSMT